MRPGPACGKIAEASLGLKIAIQNPREDAARDAAAWAGAVVEGVGGAEAGVRLIERLLEIK